MASSSTNTAPTATGQIRWHYQAVPNNNWDYDNVQQLTLLDLPINGRMRKVITQAKNGFFYVLDRVTGEFISAEPFVKVSWDPEARSFSGSCPSGRWTENRRPETGDRQESTPTPRRWQ